MPTIELRDITIDNGPAGYIPSEELIYAAEVAYALKRPLLLSGEPGTGKTEFAIWLANALADRDFAGKPLIFNTKTTSTAQDLFYYYDAISNFRDANIQRNNTGNSTLLPTVTSENYISLNAMGLAFQRAKGLSSLTEKNPVATPAQGSVVLIDEIDKAPRDFPNDLLNEIEKYNFQIKELENKTIELSDNEKKKLFIILTSNFEKNLPEAFLRRCIYFHIKFPKDDKLVEILKKRLGISDTSSIENIKKRVTDFFKFRDDNNIQKKPGTSECLDLMRVLHKEDKLSLALFNDAGKITPEGTRYLSLVLKKKEDRNLYIAE